MRHVRFWGAAACAVLLTACASTQVSPDAETRAWSAARYADTPYAYELYLRGRGDGPNAQAARVRVDSLRQAERAAWSRAQADDSETGYAGYLSSYPWGADAQTARSRRDVLVATRRAPEEPAAWDAAQRADGIENYEHYLHSFPAGAHAEAARARLAQLWVTDEGAATRARRLASGAGQVDLLSVDPQRLGDDGDAHAWARARRRDTVTQYEGYLRDQPEGAFRGDAERRVDRLEGEDRAAWERARSADTVTAYEDYRRSSGAAYWDDAARRIDQLRAQQAFPPPAPLLSPPP